jgi:hypothetical protein
VTGELGNIARDVLLAATAQVPLAGALVDYFERRKSEQDSESTRRVFDGLERELIRLKGRLVGAIEHGSELERHLSEVTTQVWIIARRSHNPVKLEASARLLANALLRDGDADSIVHAERQLFLNALESLSDAAIVLVAKCVTSIRLKGQGLLSTDTTHTIDIGELLQTTSMDPHLFMGLVGELSRFNLVITRLSRGGTPADPYEGYQLLVTPLADRFVRFLTSDQAGVKLEP